MTAANFAACFAETERWEGGYVDNPHDPGGATLKGVTQAVYTAWRASHGLPNAPVRDASDADIAAIYRAQYWNAVRGDDLYDGLDLVMSDTGWGSGPVTAVQMLQRELRMPTIDGHFGLQTLAAVKPLWNSPDLIVSLCTARMAFFTRLTTWKYFGKGWTARLEGIQAAALAMNAAARGNPKVSNLRDLQIALNRLGADPPVTPDGVYGAQTRAAVIEFQVLTPGLARDGWAGPATIAAIEAALAKVT